MGSQWKAPRCVSSSTSWPWQSARTSAGPAEACFVSQPSLSAQIAQIEAVLGVKLFERDPRGVRLTRAGEALVPEARATLAACHQLCQLARSFGAPLTGPLRLGVIPNLGPYLLPRVLPAVHESYPELQLFLREDRTAQLVEQLEAGKLDLLMLAIDIDLGGLAILPLFSDPFLVAVSEQDDLARLDEVRLSDLDGRDMLLLEEGHCLREETLPLCEAAGGGELSGFRASSLGTITQMVARGLGITLLPELAIEREAAAVRAMPCSAGEKPAPEPSTRPPELQEDPARGLDTRPGHPTTTPADRPPGLPLRRVRRFDVLSSFSDGYLGRIH